MRSRSASIYVRRSLPTLSPEDLANAIPNKIEILPFDFSTKTPSQSGDMSDLFEDFGPLLDVKFREEFSGDFVKAGQDSKIETSGLSRTSTMITDSSTLEFDELFSNEESPKNQKLLRAMVIGARNSGKHSLINALFQDHQTIEEGTKQSFDLVTKTLEKFEATQRYHFWLKEPSNNNKHDLISQVYYKSCSLFFLVYDYDRVSSFKELDFELEQIIKANSNKKLCFVLIANKRQGQRAYNSTPLEAYTLKEKYNINIFLEMNILTETPKDLRTLIDYYLKCSLGDDLYFVW